MGRYYYCHHYPYFIGVENKAREVGWVSQNNIVQKNATGLESRLPVSRFCICIYCEVIPQKSHVLFSSLSQVYVFYFLGLIALT